MLGISAVESKGAQTLREVSFIDVKNKLIDNQILWIEVRGSIETYIFVDIVVL